MVKRAILVLVLVISAFVYYRQTHRNYYDYLAMSGATPLAVARQVPSDIRLKIDGLVEKKYHFNGDALNALATTRIRTREISPQGDYLGAYIHVGIPVFNLLEGISPRKPEQAGFDQPLDILVTFHAAGGQKVRFSYNELIMTMDCHPVTLAFDRRPVVPTNAAAREHYSGNRFAENLRGLRLICPAEPDTARYLDQVVRISYDALPIDDNSLPPRRKKFKCRSGGILCIDGQSRTPGVLTDVAKTVNNRWIRIGHGHGYDDTVRAQGYDLRAFLTVNFAQVSPDDFFLFVACDGYRALFSGHEIFQTKQGAAMMIAERINGKHPEEGYMLAPTADYFSDRAMWGLAQVIRIRGDQIGT